MGRSSVTSPADRQGYDESDVGDKQACGQTPIAEVDQSQERPHEPDHDQAVRGPDPAEQDGDENRGNDEIEQGYFGDHPEACGLADDVDLASCPAGL